MWPHFNPRPTVVDVLDDGACIDGVKEWIEANDGAIAVDVVDHFGNSYIEKAGCADGSGDGSGDGYGELRC